MGRKCARFLSSQTLIVFDDIILHPPASCLPATAALPGAFAQDWAGSWTSSAGPPEGATGTFRGQGPRGESGWGRSERGEREGNGERRGLDNPNSGRSVLGSVEAVVCNQISIVRRLFEIFKICTRRHRSEIKI